MTTFKEYKTIRCATCAQTYNISPDEIADPFICQECKANPSRTSTVAPPPGAPPVIVPSAPVDERNLGASPVHGVPEDFQEPEEEPDGHYKDASIINDEQAQQQHVDES